MQKEENIIDHHSIFTFSLKIINKKIMGNNISTINQKKIFLLSFISNIKKPANAGFSQNIQW
ncbi:hypothetical protein [Xenorhabdus bovienii]|uniref:hypothetical protein n=1 Tax=Xenorhabdus bovienii TaxID=40576 RepID=UPI0023B2DF28|nr:hypothetical protein [Xenorhabdus bovienii]